MLKAISDLLNNKLLKRKTYCKRFLFEILLQQCRQLLGHVTLDHILSIYLKSIPDLRYAQLSTLMSEVFLDNRSERFSITKANKMVEIEFREGANLFQRRLGLGFMTCCPVCCVCLNPLKGQPDDIVVFECEKAKFNHAYHSKCLTKKLKARMRKEQTTELKLRCLACAPHNTDIRLGGIEKRTFDL